MNTPRDLDATLPLPPDAIRAGDAIAFGRYRAPIPDPDFRPSFLERMRLKEWHYTSFTTDQWFLAIGIVQLGYVASAFAYLVDRRRPTHPPREFEAMSPLGAALRFAPSSVAGTSRWRRRHEAITIEWMEPEWRVKLRIPFADAVLKGELRLANTEALALVHPLEAKRAAYTHKAAGMPATGVLDLGDQRLDFRQALGVVDWTRSLAKRETQWKWASFSGRDVEGRVVGLNLSADVYDDAHGDSQENALFVDGKVLPLGGVRFEVPQDPGVNDWRIVSREASDEPEVDLTFEPFGARRQSVDYRLVKSDFIQPYGVFRGRIAGHEIADAFGVVEDHRAVW